MKRGRPKAKRVPIKYPMMHLILGAFGFRKHSDLANLLDVSRSCVTRWDNQEWMPHDKAEKIADILYRLMLPSSNMTALQQLSVVRDFINIAKKEIS